MKSFIKKKKKWIIAAGVIILAVAGYFYFIRPSGPAFATVEVKLGNIYQEVSVTGNVKPAENADLAFESSGRVSKIFVSVGDAVVSGQSLIELDDAQIYAQLAGAQADLKVQEAKLDQLQIGTRPEQIQISQTKVDNAQVVIDEAKKTLVDKIKNSYTTSDDAVRNKADSLFVTPAIPGPRLNFSLANNQLQINIQNQRTVLEELLRSWSASLVNLSSNSDLSSYVAAAKQNLGSISSFLDDVNAALGGLTANASLLQTTIDGWKSGISTARSNISAAIDDVSSAETDLKNAQSDLSLAQQQLALDKAGSTPEEVAAQQAQVEKAKADILNYEAQYDKMTLRSPISGIVSKQDVKMGEIVSADQVIASVISASQFEIESNVPEADIAKIKIGDEANITLDAYGDAVVFKAKVSKIDPAETVIEGVSTYKTTLQFEQNDERIKSGITANIDISTDKRENVLVIPQRAIATRGTDKFVYVDNGAKIPEERKIESGLKGIDGNVEVVSGLNEGEKISALGSIQ